MSLPGARRRRKGTFSLRCMVDLLERALPSAEELAGGRRIGSMRAAEFSYRCAMSELTLAAAQQRVDEWIRTIGVRYFSDASVLAHGGIPAWCSAPATSPRRIRRTNGWRWSSSSK